MSNNNQQTVKQNLDVKVKPNTSKPWKGLPPPTKERGDPKWVVGEQPLATDLRPSNKFPESFSVVIGIPGVGNTEYIVHHPIGIVIGANEDDWVITPQSEMADLWARREDSSRPGLDAQRSALTNEYLVSERLLVRDDFGRIFYPEPALAGIGDRKTILNLIKSGSEGITAEAKATVADLEDRIRAAKQEPRLLSQLAPLQSSYETCSGPLSDRRQVVEEDLRYLLPSVAKDVLVLRILKRALPAYLRDVERRAPRRSKAKPKTERMRDVASVPHGEMVINPMIIPPAGSPNEIISSGDPTIGNGNTTREPILDQGVLPKLAATLPDPPQYAKEGSHTPSSSSDTGGGEGRKGAPSAFFNSQVSLSNPAKEKKTGTVDKGKK